MNEAIRLARWRKKGMHLTPDEQMVVCFALLKLTGSVEVRAARSYGVSACCGCEAEFLSHSEFKFCPSCGRLLNWKKSK